MLNLWMLTLMFALHTPALGYVHLVNDRTLDLNNGNQLLLWCTDRNLSALPNLKSLAWSKDNVHIPNHDPRLNTDASKSILLIEQLRENDEGVYNCTVEAEAFLSINITRLRVLGKGPPTITSIGSRLQTNNAAPTSTQKPLKDMKVNRILELQQKVTDLLRGNSTESISTFITELVNLTKPENEIKLKAFELSSSLNMLVQFVQYNSILNNTAINSSTDQQNVIQVASNLLEEENTKTWLRLQKANDSVTDDFLKTMDEFGSQVSSQLGGQDNSTSLVVLTRNVGFRADRLTSRQMLNVDFSHYGATIFVPGEVVSANPSATRASTIVYKTLNNILSLPMESKHEKENEQKRFKSSSSIVSATIVPRPSSPLRKPVKFVFNNTNKRSNVDRDCVFWEVRRPERVWQTQGCVRVDQESDAGVTTCECNHFTIFAVLMNNKPVDARHKSYLQYISTIGCACSLLFLLLTFIVIALCWKRLKSPRVTFLLHLCIAIAASCILLILPGYVHWEEVGCVVNAALLHYFLLCVFTWMMCHGGMLYYLIIKVELRDKLKPKMKWFYAFGWGLPVLIVAVSLAVTGTKKYAASNCWLTLERGLIYWAFVGPVAVVIFVNSILFVFLLWRINRVSKFRESMTRAQHVKAWLRRSIVLLPVLGVTWSFGLLTFISSTVVFHYLFTIFNSLQGFVIFFNFCIIDYEVRAVMISTLCRRHYTASLNEAKETANRHGERRVSVQTLPAVPAKTQWKEEQGFHNMAQNTADSEIQLPKIQTWMTSIHL